MKGIMRNIISEKIISEKIRFDLNIHTGKKEIKKRICIVL